MKKIAILLAAACAMLFAASCSKTQETPFVTTTGVSISPATTSILTGELTTLKATLTPSDASSRYMTWKSSNDKIATVDGWGRVLGITPGEVTITVTTDSGNKTATAKVTVNPIKETSVTLSETSLKVYADETETLTATVAPDDATYKDVVWSSSDVSVATVNSKGVITGVEYGNCVITATSHFGITASCNVNVTLRTPSEPETVEMWKTDKAGARGLYGAASDNGKTAGTGDWLSYNDGIVTWTANTTGEARKATLTLSTGSKITIKQVGVADFVGDYELHSKAYYAASPVSNTTLEAANKYITTGIKFTSTSDYEEVNGKTPNIVVTGLYYDFKLPACLEVDAENGPQLYFYLTNLEYQTVSNNTEVACIPEETKSATSWNNYSLAPVKFGEDDCNYFWLPVAINLDEKKLTVGETYAKVSDGAYCYGLAFVVKGYAAGSYKTIFQFNWGNVERNSYWLKK